MLASVAIGTANIHVLRSFEQAVTTVAGPATLEIAGHDLGVDESVIAAIRTVEGVVSAAPVMEESVVLTQGELRGQALQILGLDLLAETGARGFRISEGRHRPGIGDAPGSGRAVPWSSGCCRLESGNR